MFRISAFVWRSWPAPTCVGPGFPAGARPPLAVVEQGGGDCLPAPTPGLGFPSSLGRGWPIKPSLLCPEGGSVCGLAPRRPVLRRSQLVDTQKKRANWIAGGWGLIRGDFGGQFLRGPKSAGPSSRTAGMGPLWGWPPSTMVIHCGPRSGGHTAGAGRGICFLPRSSSLPGAASQLGRGAGGGPGSTDSTQGGGGGIRSAAP